MEQLQEEKRDELTAIRADIYADVKVNGCGKIRRLFAPLICSLLSLCFSFRGSNFSGFPDIRLPFDQRSEKSG